MEGLKIAMVIHTNKEPICSNVDVLVEGTGTLNDDDLHLIFGYADTTNVYTSRTVSIHSEAAQEPSSFRWTRISHRR
jgi:hypothetical protein